LTERVKSLIAFFGMLLAITLLLWLSGRKVNGAEFGAEEQAHANYLRLLPVPPEFAYNYSPYRTASIEVAKVFGRSPSCANADADFITEVGRTAVYNGLDPRIAAATIAVESGCNDFAVSSRGAIGLMQIRVSSWKNQYDFGGKVNLLNRHDNVRVGTEILSKLVQQYGTAEGLHRYNGLGQDCATCDPSYAAKILSLAGRG